MSERCPRCDREVCESNRLRLHGVRGWHLHPSDDECRAHAVDWRARALAAEVRVAELEIVGEKLFRQVMDANGWINFEWKYPGAGLCICFEDDPDFDIDTCKPPTEHSVVCVPFREAIAAWKAVRRG